MAKMTLLTRDSPGNPGAEHEEGRPVGVYEDDKVLTRSTDKRIWQAELDAWLAEDPQRVQEDWEHWPWDGTFMLLELPGMPVAKLKRAIEPWERPALPSDPEWNNEDAADRRVRRGRFRWRLKMDQLTNSQRRKLRRDAVLTVPHTRAFVNQVIKDRDESNDDFEKD